jgi:hypothetical protein
MHCDAALSGYGMFLEPRVSIGFHDVADSVSSSAQKFIGIQYLQVLS